jgi:hypothetical protein
VEAEGGDRTTGLVSGILNVVHWSGGILEVIKFSSGRL